MQLKLIDDAVKHFPHTQWWNKADGCDLSKGLGESVGGVWSGDVDLNDGSLESQYSSYCERLSFVEGLGLRDRSTKPCIMSDMVKIRDEFQNDIKFVTEGYYTCNYSGCTT